MKPTSPLSSKSPGHGGGAAGLGEAAEDVERAPSVARLITRASKEGRNRTAPPFTKSDESLTSLPQKLTFRSKFEATIFAFVTVM